MMSRVWRVVYIASLLAMFFSFGAQAEAPRTGALVDEVVFVEEADLNKAIDRVKAGELDFITLGISKAPQFNAVKEARHIEYETSFGSFNEITLNPAGPVLSNGKLNPFGVPAIREALNTLIDRDYIANEICGGLAIPKYFPLNSSFPDYATFADVIAKLQTQIAYNPDKARATISAEMQKLGAKLVNNKWTYNNQPVVLTFIIRNEDERKDMGDYIATQLESAGFTVDRQYKRSAEASPIVFSSNPAEGQWHLYTSGWITTVIDRDEGENFQFFYLPSSAYVTTLHQSFRPTAEFQELGDKLANRDFATLDERKAMFSKALELSVKDSVRIFLIDRISIWPRQKDIKMATDLAGGMSGTWIWPFTLQRVGQVGGRVTVGNQSVLTDPWNPIAGTNWAYDMIVIRGIGEYGMYPDPFTGLYLSQRIKSADVIMKKGLPVGKTHDYVNLSFVDTNKVPADAWIDWDAKAQRFITVGEKYPQGLTANRRVVLRYQDDMFKVIKWHDGSNLSAADFILNLILTFDRANPDSAVYDESAVPNFQAFQDHFRGFKVVQQNPLVVEYYSDLWYVDAEENASGADLYPFYQQGPGAWHNLAIGLQAEAAGELAFSTAKADKLKVEWMSYVAGPSLSVLNKHLTQAAASGYLPYAPTLGKYVAAGEVASRYANLQQFYAARNHFFIGTGVFYLDTVRPTEKILVLKRNTEFPDPSTKWAGFSEPKLATADISGTNRLRKNQKADFAITITFKNQPYPSKDINFVKYLVFDSKSNVVISGDARQIRDGYWQVNIPATEFAKMSIGPGKLQVAVSVKPVGTPAFDTFEFVVLP